MVKKEINEVIGKTAEDFPKRYLGLIKTVLMDSTHTSMLIVINCEYRKVKGENDYLLLDDHIKG